MPETKAVLAAVNDLPQKLYNHMKRTTGEDDVAPIGLSEEELQ